VLSLLLKIACLRSVQSKSCDIPRLKVILMSATIQTSKFSEYVSRYLSSFQELGRKEKIQSSAPILNITGQLFPVHEFYLENIKLFLRESSPEKRGDLSTETFQIRKKNDGIPYRLMVSLILRLSQDSTRLASHISVIASGLSGAVLVFLPGIAEIFHFISLFESLSAECSTNVTQRFLLLPLHGSLSNSEQRKVFDLPPSGVVKIVVATNIAEASITIPDITVVIDSCLVKEMLVSPESKVLQHSLIRPSSSCRCPSFAPSSPQKITSAREREERGEFVRGDASVSSPRNLTRRYLPTTDFFASPSVGYSKPQCPRNASNLT
jgi:HrpA-like RNA helicase